MSHWPPDPRVALQRLQIFVFLVRLLEDILRADEACEGEGGGDVIDCETLQHCSGAIS